MVGATMIFGLLAIFYYDYVPEGTFKDADQIEEDEKAEIGIGIENVALEKAEEAEKTEEAEL